MKFYVHGEDPELTLVIIWEKDKPGSVQDIVKVFCDNLKNKYPSVDKEKLCEHAYGVKNSRGKTIAQTSEVSASVKHMDDLFLAIDPTIKSTSKSISEQKPSLDTGNVDYPDTKDDQFDGQFNAAFIHISNERYRKAIQIYKTILSIDSKNRSALAGLAVCYIKAGRFKKALQYANKGLSHYQEDTELLLIVGQCYVALKKGDKAIETLMNLTKIIRKTQGSKPEEKHEIQVLLAKAYLLKDQKDMAITILQGVLRENLEHSEALVEYAAILHTIGPAQCQDAITALLSVLAKKQKDSRSREVFTTVCTQPGGMEILKSVASAVWKDVHALLYLAICLKECSAIRESLELMMTAHKLDPGNPNTALIYVHTLELLDNCKDIICFYKQYFSSCPNRGVAQLTSAFVNRYLSGVLTKDLEVNQDELETLKNKVYEDCDMFEVPGREFTEDELYFLALLCTLIKILYIKGCLSVIPPLLAMVKPFCQDKQLHLTNIRNEVAFYSCIQEVFATYTEIPATVSPGCEKVIYMIGDSHCIPAAWQEIYVKDTCYQIYPILSTGTKIWHLREESNFYPKVNFNSAIKAIPNGATVITCFGEIDCREAFLRCWEKARYDKIEDAMSAVTQIYLNLLKRLRESHNWRVFIHPVLPVLDLTRPIVMQFNRILATHLLTETDLHWLNFVHELISADESALRDEYKLDGTHIHPRYKQLLAQVLSEEF